MSVRCLPERTLRNKKHMTGSAGIKCLQSIPISRGRDRMALLVPQPG